MPRAAACRSTRARAPPVRSTAPCSRSMEAEMGARATESTRRRGQSSEPECIRGPDGYGVVGDASGVGVMGFADGIGVWGNAPATGSVGVLADGDYRAVLANGDVDVDGSLFKTAGSLRIDHPLYPADRYLNHAFVESSEQKNIDDGIAIADDSGRVTVVLPDRFEALNEEIRYQLTPLGEPAPNLHVAKDLSAGRFDIAGARPRQRVCWQATGVRKDPYAKAHPLIVEEEKPDRERGLYRHPELYGEPLEKSIARTRRPRAQDDGGRP